MRQRALLPLVRHKTIALFNKYISVDELTSEGIDEYIVGTPLGDNVGVLGELRSPEPRLISQVTTGLTSIHS